jgi:hypothetical protein
MKDPNIIMELMAALSEQLSSRLEAHPELSGDEQFAYCMSALFGTICTFAHSAGIPKQAFLEEAIRAIECVFDAFIEDNALANFDVTGKEPS